MEFWELLKRHERWMNWYHFFSNRNPYMTALFPEVVEEDGKFRELLKGNIPINAQKLR